MENGGTRVNEPHNLLLVPDELDLGRCEYCMQSHGCQQGTDNECFKHLKYMEEIRKRQTLGLLVPGMGVKPRGGWHGLIGCPVNGHKSQTFYKDREYEDVPPLIPDQPVAKVHSKVVGSGKPNTVVTPVEPVKIAAEMAKEIKETEKESRKKLKKKEKKKRQKAKKKELESKPSIEEDNDSSDESDGEGSKDGNSEDLIANSAFAAGTKKGGKLASLQTEFKAPAPASVLQTAVQKQPEREEQNGNGNESDTSDKYNVAYDQLESKRKAHEGAVWTKEAVSYEQKGKPIAARSMYTEALMSFNKAIKLWPHDCRYYANRSYVYTQLGHFTDAIRDADSSIALDTDFVKGYYRKGQALIGLKKYDEADSCFLKILELDPDCEEARDEIRGVKFLRLKDMGFADDDINASLEKHPHAFEDALQELISKPQSKQPVRVPSPTKPPTPTPVKPLAARPIAPLIETKPVEVIPTTSGKIIVKDNVTVNPNEDPRNPLMSKSIWVGNLNDITEKCEKKIRTLFSPFGNIVSVYIKPDSRCAFVNYADHKSAGNAMKAMQGQKFGVNTLLIRYPANNNAATTQNKPNLVLAKGTVVIGNKQAAARPAVENKNPERIGTIECRHWRSGNCTYGTSCWYKHVPENKGIEKP